MALTRAALLGGGVLGDVVEEGVHDDHGLGGDTGVVVNLLQDLVDVDGEGLLEGPGDVPVRIVGVRVGLLDLAEDGNLKKTLHFQHCKMYQKLFLTFIMTSPSTATRPFSRSVFFQPCLRQRQRRTALDTMDTTVPGRRW